MKKQQLPSVSTLTAANLKEFSTSDRVVIVGFFDKDAGAAKKVFEQVAEKMRDDFVFGAIGDAKAVKEYKLTSPAIALFKKFDEGLAVYSGEFTEAAVSKFVTDSSMPIMDEVGPDNYELYMKRGLPLAFFFYGDAEQRAQYGPLLESVAKDFVGKVSFVYLDASKFGGHAPNLALREEWPAFGIQDNNKKWPFDQDKELTKQAVHDFVAGVADGTLEPTLKSDPIPETQEGPVTVVVGKTFEKIVRDTNKDVFIELYAPWCGHCKKLAPTWDELARTIKAATDDAIVVAKMDATTNDLPPSVDFNLQGFPTLLLFKAGSNEIVSYSGDRSLKSLLDFVRANAVHADKLPESVEETPALKAEETPVLNADERDEL
nr:protein disulfide-isomerase precursor [Polyrhizophydium stewartii]